MLIVISVLVARDDNNSFLTNYLDPSCSQVSGCWGRSAPIGPGPAAGGTWGGYRDGGRNMESPIAHQACRDWIRVADQRGWGEPVDAIWFYEQHKWYEL
eukprot:1187667-Prorocentrum_minimum.AAC.3